MQNTVNCPKCGTPLRDGAKFCAKCGNSMVGVAMPAMDRASRAATRPLTSPMPPKPAARPTISLNNASVQPPPASSRPLNAIIADRYLVTGLSFDDGKLFSYPVTEFHLPNGERTLQCPNPACGAVHWKSAYVGEYPASVCDECNTPLDLSRFPELVLNEVLDPAILGHAPEVARLGLIHSYLRAPIDTAVELVCGQPRTLVVEPRVNPLPDQMERVQVLQWLPGLAAALDYLHFNGVTFRGQVSSTCFGLYAGRAVWSHFAVCTVAAPGQEVPAADRAADVRGLALRMFAWMTGREQFAVEPTLSSGLNAFFTQAITGPGFTSGADLVRGLEQSQQEPRSAAPVEYRFGRRTDVGRVRTLNEDSILTIETSRATTNSPRPAGVFVIADGMGGHAAGEVASGAIVSYIQSHCLGELGSAVTSGAAVDWQNWLKATVEQVNKHVFDMRKASGTDMGSTMVMALMDGARAYIAHIGDSRAYLVNNREIRRLTVDHSLVERLVATGQIRREEAHNHPQKNVIYRTVGDKPRVEVETSVIDLAVGDRLLLCSDGLCGMVLDDQIQKIVLNANGPQSACDGLVTAANAAGGEDNISVIVVEIVRG